MNCIPSRSRWKDGDVRTYGQYCPIARASELLAERWSVIILRNIVILGCRTFNEIADGAPGLSRGLLSKRLRELERAGATVTALVAVIAELQTQISRARDRAGRHFEQHPDAKIIRSLPGLGMTLGARVLGEFGDDPNRYADAKCRKNYAGTSPITRASGKTHVVLARYARNRRLADACYQWAFAALTASPGARAFYDQRRAAGDTHNRALRALANRLVGILHGCLRHHTPTTNTPPGDTAHQLAALQAAAGAGAGRRAGNPSQARRPRLDLPAHPGGSRVLRRHGGAPALGIALGRADP